MADDKRQQWIDDADTLDAAIAIMRRESARPRSWTLIVLCKVVAGFADALRRRAAKRERPPQRVRQIPRIPR